MKKVQITGLVSVLLVAGLQAADSRLRDSGIFSGNSSEVLSEGCSVSGSRNNFDSDAGDGVAQVQNVASGAGLPSSKGVMARSDDDDEPGSPTKLALDAREELRTADKPATVGPHKKNTVR